ncbi:hypothetical protein RN001_012936 [Aquatica leii]|uniref:Uncharacterized protein n=1 Tax=Aquatica leii TaxID=1421715 RepID=A0AAN7P3N0_9COLE|nr:hypothetical protein RN001_012936 [Aquatica leii]
MICTLDIGTSQSQVYHNHSTSQSKIFRTMVDTPWYVSNQTLHQDLGIPFIKEFMQEKSNKHHARLEIHTNLLIELLLPNRNNKRLKRQST